MRPHAGIIPAMTEQQSYTPELLPRRGEMNAWLLAIAATLGLAALQFNGIVPTWAWFFVAFLFLSAASISLGNWMDRNTRINLGPEGVAFSNGLRRVHLAWEQIREVRTLPARWGQTVQVLGTEAHFEFNTLGEVHFRGELRGKTGFAQGKTLLDQIIRAAGLTTMTQSEQFTTYSRGQ